MYSAPLRDSDHRREREEWARRLREEQAAQESRQETLPAPRQSVPGLSGDAALVGLILFLLSDRTKNDTVLLCILAYLLLS